MATWDDVRRIAMALPEVTERPTYDNRPAWRVKDKPFAWDRPLRKNDPAVPSGPILAASVPDLGAKEALLADDPTVYFTIPHLDNYAAVLVHLDPITTDDLAELLTEAWLCRAPKTLAEQFTATHHPR
ncbi:MmcQ/YjbR family DNA-binding protein [Actinosynnema sp. NPDC091369]